MLRFAPGLAGREGCSERSLAGGVTPAESAAEGAAG